MTEAAPVTPAVAVDVAVLGVRDRRLQVLLVRPRTGPFAGAWALPGGRVRVDESLDEAACRELAAQTGLGNLYLEQLYTFGNPGRDPGGRVVSVAYLALVPEGGRSAAAAGPAGEGGKYAEAGWHPARRPPPLGYDHAAVVRRARDRLRAKLTYTNLAYTLLPDAFTLAELQETYEAILGRALDRRNFRKKILSLDLLRRLDRQRRGPHRPATLYAFRHRHPIVIDIL